MSFRSRTTRELFTLAARAASPITRMRSRNYAGALIHQPIFIVGAPRTGSTILYQGLTNRFDVLYFDNLVCQWHANLLLGFWISQRRYGSRPHNNFSSRYGDTGAAGPHAPSECGDFWYRWLPRTHHFIDDSEVTQKIVRKIRREVVTVSNRYDRPIVFKNLANGQRLRLISQCFPEAKIVFLTRLAEGTVRSILEARHAQGVGESELWSIKPKDYRSLLSLSEVDMVRAQVAALDMQIEADLSRFNPGNVFRVKYENLSEELLDQLGLSLRLKRRVGGSTPDFKPDPSPS